MRKILNILIALAVITGISFASAMPAVAASCTQDGFQHVVGGGVGSYYVNSDNWGGGDTCITTDGNADFAVASQDVAYDGNVLAYPNIDAGCGTLTGLDCTANWSSEPVSALGSPKETWNTTVKTNSSAEYDVANDIWFAPTANGCPTTELMIFINGQNLQAPPTTQVTINNVPYYYKTYKASNATCSWNYVQFRRVNSVKSITNMPLMPFFKYAESQNVLVSSNYMRQFSAGFELWSYGAGLQTTNFSVTE